VVHVLNYQISKYVSRFGEITRAYEECRADGVALYLSTYKDVFDVLFPGREEFDDILYTTWLSVLRMGLRALEDYNSGRIIIQRGKSGCRPIAMGAM